MAVRMELEHLLLTDAAACLKWNEERLLLLGAEGKIELIAQISDCPLERGGSWSGRVTLTKDECARLAKRRDKFAWIAKIQDGDEVLAVPFEHQRAIITREDVLVSASICPPTESNLTAPGRATLEQTIGLLTEVVARLSKGDRFRHSDGKPKFQVIADQLSTMANGRYGMEAESLRTRLSKGWSQIQ